MTNSKEMEALEALREICKSSHCVSDTLRIKLKPWEVTARKNIVYNALTELEEIKARAETAKKDLQEEQKALFARSGLTTNYVSIRERLINYILKGETK